MIASKKHRVIDEIEKSRRKGQCLHFLTGDAISLGDNYLYNFYHGVKSLDETLRLFYMEENDVFDYFIHVINNNNSIKCYVKSGMGSLFQAAERKSVFGAGSKNRRQVTDSTEIEAAKSHVQEMAGDINSHLERLTDIIENGDKEDSPRILILLENMEWIANLHDQADVSWISRLQNPIWQKARKLMTVITIKDMKLLEKYSFGEKETFIANPTAEEIFLSYWRYILHNTDSSYKYDLKILDDIAHTMSVGKKSLVQCMRILRNITESNKVELDIEDFSRSAELNIEEKILWDDVILNQRTKREIEEAIDSFLDPNPSNSSRKGLILTGPPGTGKTMIAKALANERHCYFMAPTLADLKGEYVGQTSGKVKRIFSEARGNQPTILFIDEADTVFPNRSMEGGDSFGLDMVNQFLQELDGAKTGKQKIFTIAATNRIEVMDSAVRSRLSGTPLEIPLPDYENRRRLFNQRLKPFSLDGKFFTDEVLTKSGNLSGRDIDNICKQVKEKANSEGVVLGNNQASYKIFKAIFGAREKRFVHDCIAKGIFTPGNVLAPDQNRERLNNVVGYQHLKAEIYKQIRYIIADASEKNRYDEFTITSPKGIIMYGPPGNAKSKLAQAVAGEYGFYFLKILSQDFVSSHPDQQIKMLGDIFGEVEKFSKMMDHPGIVLFFDEFDSLAGKNVLNPIVRGTLLNFIADEKGIRSKNSKILFITATNYYNNIDEAIKRSGRIDTHLFMDNPTESNGKKMLKMFFAKDKNVTEVDESIIERAYEEQVKKSRKNPETRRRLLIELYGSGEIYERLSVHDRAIVDEKLQEVRPSGAELYTLYNNIKGIAFMDEKNAGAKQLIISHDIVENYFNDSEVD